MSIALLYIDKDRLNSEIGMIGSNLKGRRCYFNWTIISHDYGKKGQRWVYIMWIKKMGRVNG